MAWALGRRLSAWRRRSARHFAAWHFEQSDWQQRIAGAHVLYFGERHDQPAMLDAQRAVLETWASQGQSALVLEMFSEPQQDILETWDDRSFEENQKLYESSGDFDFTHYGQLVEAARRLGFRIEAGFPTRVAARAACEEKSPQQLELKEMQRLLGAGAADHYRLFAGMIAGTSLEQLDSDVEAPKRGQHIFPAQSWKDLVCAQKVFAAAMTSKVMVITGCGHTDYSLGVPQRVEALVNEEFWSGLHQQVAYSMPLVQRIITAREIDEDLCPTFRGRSVADLVLRYKPSQVE